MSNDKTYTSFGGTDITAVFGNKIFGELMMVNYRTNREKAPVYTMGSVDPRSIARGKRLITGACVFTVFDRDSLLEAMSDCVWLSRDEIDTYGDLGEYSETLPGSVNGGLGSLAVRSGGSVRGVSGQTVGDTFTSVADKFKAPSRAILADQILPFDISLVGVSEYGKSIQMNILGVELMAESGGVSVDDITLEKQLQFIARRVTPWTPVEMPNSNCKFGKQTTLV